MSASIAIWISQEGMLNGVEVSVSGTPFLTKVPKTLTASDGRILSLETSTGGYNNFRWICKGIAYGNKKSQDCFFKNTKEGCQSFKIYMDGLCVTYGLKMSSERVNAY